MKIEKRKFKRFGPDDLAFAVFRPEFERLGRIKDISRGGLSCVYLDDKFISKNGSELKVDILLPNGEFYLSVVPCEVIYDLNMVEEEYKSSISFMESRRCGLKFGELSDDQTAQLDFFLNNHIYRLAKTA